MAGFTLAYNQVAFLLSDKMPPAGDVSLLGMSKI